MKKDSMEIDKEYGALGKFAAAGYRDARQNFKWMHDMQRMTELEDFYDYTREPEKKQKYREELTAGGKDPHEPQQGPAAADDVPPGSD